MKKDFRHEYPVELGTERIDYCIHGELQGARAKFPTNEHMMTALTEEVGELAKALLELHYGKGTKQEVFAEAIQVASMAIRVATEGSAEFNYEPDYSCYRDFKPTGTK